MTPFDASQPAAPAQVPPAPSAPPNLAAQDPNNENLPEELQTVLYNMVKEAEDEDAWIRKQQIKGWKRQEEFWHGVQYIFWSESRQDWITPTDVRWFQQEEGREEAEGPFYDYVINIYKAHGEAVIAALGAQTPAVRFPPDDAENEEDLITSRTFAKIADLIMRHNNSKILVLRALFTLCNQGLVCAYHAPKSDKMFGEIEIPEFEQDEEGNNVLVGTTKKAKTRTIIELYGPLNVKIPVHIEKQSEAAYLICKKDHPISLLKNLYPHVREKLDQSMNDMDQYEKGARTPSNYSLWSRIDENRNLRTLSRVWFRPWHFDGIADSFSKERDQLKSMFPDGCYVAFIGRTYVESRNENLDKYWTIGQSGLSRYIHSDPYLEPLLPVQEMTNVLANLTMETIEQGIPSTFADTDTLNFEAYSRHEARPGMVYPIKVKTGSSANEKFYEQGRATLSREVQYFADYLEKTGQFVVGAFPSVYGGPSQSSSRTASEYNMSRQMALQRLGLLWTFLVDWWTKTVDKSVRLFAESMTEDERFVFPGEGRGDSNYINVWIRRAEMTGKVGEVEPEGAETFPISTPQKQELLMRLLGMQNDMLNAAIFDPENRHLIADTLAYPDIFIPGEDQRTKQALEIQQILKGAPAMVEPEVDDHGIHIEVIKNWAVGASGLDCKQNNPQGYMMVLDHLKEHQMIAAQEMQAQLAAQQVQQQHVQHSHDNPNGGQNPGTPPAPKKELGQQNMIG